MVNSQSSTHAHKKITEVVARSATSAERGQINERPSGTCCVVLCCEGKTRESVRERVCVCVRERVCVCERERVCVCVESL